MIFTYTYFYNEPYVIDEEYTKKIEIKIINKILEPNKIIHIPDPDVSINVSFFSIWDLDTSYGDFMGQIQILEMTKKHIKISILLNGKYLNEEKRRDLLYKTLKLKL